MKIRFQALAVALAFISTAKAQEVEYAKFDVKGLPNSPKADKEGYAVALLDTGLEALQVSAAATVRDTIGSIDSAQLFVRDKEGKLVTRALLLAWKMDGQTSSTMEFDIRRDLLENSFILIKTRKDNTVSIAKVQLGTFHISMREKGKSNN